MLSKGWKIPRYDFFFKAVLHSSSVKEQSWISELMNAVSSLALSAEALSVTACPSTLSFSLSLSLSPSRYLLLQGVMCHYPLIRSCVSGLCWYEMHLVDQCFQSSHLVLIMLSSLLTFSSRQSVWEFFFFSQTDTHTRKNLNMDIFLILWLALWVIKAIY